MKTNSRYVLYTYYVGHDRDSTTNYTTSYPRTVNLIELKQLTISRADLKYNYRNAPF